MTDQELIEKLVEAVNGFCQLNCARPPLGKHYKKDPYCGECTSCRARALMEEIGHPVKFEYLGDR